MSNLLIEAPPDSISIDGRDHEVNTDFRTCLKIILAFEDPELTMEEKAMILVGLLYKERPDNIRAAIEQGVKFLDGGMDRDETEVSPYRVYSFEKDSRLIMAGFRQTYGLDLNQTKLHWWEFLTLMLDLSPDTTFSNLVSLRQRVKSGKATKEERQTASELGDIFEIEDVEDLSIDELEKQREFLRIWQEGKARREKEKENAEKS